MKLKLLLTFFVLTLSITPLSAQLLEDFENGDKGFWNTAIVDLPTGSWFMDQALIGSDSRDRKVGSQSVRIRTSGGTNGTLQMQFDFPDGAQIVQFYLANSGFANDINGVLQVEYSTTGGSSWQALGGPITAPDDELELQTLPVEVEGPIRFRFRHVSGGRMNIDEVFIEPFLDPQPDATLSVQRGNDTIEEGGTLAFPTQNVGNNTTINLRFRNLGEPDLVVSDVSLQSGNEFSISGDGAGTYEMFEEGNLSVTFSPTEAGSFSDVLTFSSNDPNTPQFTIDLAGSGASEADVITIAEAREFELGTRVTVAGRVSLGNEFEGPAFIQDETAGIAVFWSPFHTTVQRGDSVIVTGPVTEFNPINGTPRTFLRQIAPFEGDDNITFEIVDVPQELVEPQLITLADMNAGGFESQLVTVNNVAFQSTGSFQGGTNYDISDASGSGELRIDQNATDLVNAAIPAEPVEITGVVDRFAGTFQLKPRDSNDIEIEVFEPVGEDIPKDETFDVVTWNIEWFGSESNGPDDTELQLQNVITVVETIDADLYALQEIANEQRFNELVSLLDEYEGFWANYSNQVQNTAYLYKPSVIQFIDSGLLTTNQVEFDWAFRLPLFFEFNATVQGMTRHIFSYNVHAKALADQESYDRRTNASLRLKIFLDGNRANDNVLFIGDYNDRLITSTFDDLDSPYKNFVDDANYYTITKSLDERGLASFIAGQNRSMIDHITVTNDLSLDHIDGAERVENPNFIGSFISTTSDHAPVWTRFDFSRSLVSLEDEVAGLPDTFELQQNFPNPFNPSTNIAFTLSQADLVTIQVYDIMGRLVATVANGQQFNAGSHTVNFDATGLSSGMYIYRVNLGGGQSLSRKMTLIK